MHAPPANSSDDIRSALVVLWWYLTALATPCTRSSDDPTELAQELADLHADAVSSVTRVCCACVCGPCLVSAAHFASGAW